MPEQSGLNEHSSRPGVTWRSLFIGSIAVLIIAVGIPYNGNIIKGSSMTIDFSTGAALFLGFVLCAIVNPLLRLFYRRAALTGSELLVIFMMMVIACAVPDMGMTSQLLPIPTAPFYYATPENKWIDEVWPHFAPWMAPSDMTAIRYFYEGKPKGTDIPWSAWAAPLATWGVFLLAVYFVMICMSVLACRQWTDRERLVFPLTRLPIEMATEPEEGGLFSPIFKKRLLWIGFAIPFTVGSLLALHRYFPFVPTVRTAWSTPIQAIPGFRIVWRVSFVMLGFTYLVNLDVAFSLWFFNLVGLVQKMLARYLGFQSKEDMGIYGIGPYPDLAHQGTGAMAVLVLFMLWAARFHLRDVVKKAFSVDESIDDSKEMLSHRTAFFGMIAGTAFICIWLRLAGLPLFVTLFFVMVTFMFFVGLTRLVTEGGQAEAVASSIGPSIAVSALGTGVFGPAGLTVMGVSYVWCSDIRTFVMASCCNGLRMCEETGGKRRRIFWAVMLGLILSMVASVIMAMILAYEHGGINLQSWFFVNGPKYPYRWVVKKMTLAPGPSWRGWAFMGIGAGAMAALMWCHHMFVWWPFHPLGFTIGSVWIMDQIWFSIFLAWLLKLIVLRYGGAKLFVRSRPFFLGLILGQFVCSGLWIIVDACTGKVGNSLFWV